MNKDRILVIFAIIVLSAGAIYSATQTSSLGLYRFAIGDTDYSTNQNTNMDTLDAAILDKRVGGTVTGQVTVSTLVVTGGFSIPGLSSTTLNGVELLGAKTDVEIRNLICLTSCLVYNTTESALYESTGSLAGQFRNTRTGTGP